MGRSGSPVLPSGAPHFFARAKGAFIWDIDGRQYLDFLCGLGPNLLGYGHPFVEEAAARQRALGDTMTGPTPLMVDLGERLVETISHADWVIYAKNGVDVTSAALRIARAQTERRGILVATGSYHGAHAWCLPRTPGVLPQDHAHRTEYRYNDIESLDVAAKAVGDDLAAIFATAFRHDLFAAQEPPDPRYARRCREICDRTGALLIVDDIRAGFRIARDCSWETVGVRPDLSCWSKAIANGYPLSVLVGSKNTRTGASRALLSGTYWIQAVPMAASLATLQVIRESDYLERMVKLGDMLRSGLSERAKAHGFEMKQTGPVQMPMIQLDHDPDFRYSMAFASGMIGCGIYMVPYHNLFLCAAMTANDIDRTIDAGDRVLADLSARRSEIQPHSTVLQLLTGANSETQPERV
jgi:glutamate-1-semialdehyde 2,1-aminomutase